MGKNIYMYLQQKVVYMGTVYMTCIYNIILHVHIVVFRLFCTCNCRELHMHTVYMYAKINNQFNDLLFYN